MAKDQFLVLAFLTLLVLVRAGKLGRHPLVVCISENDSNDSNNKPQSPTNATKVIQNTTCITKFCELCNQKGVCKECEPGYFLKGQPARCVPNCCKGHRLVNGKCRKQDCISIRHCLKCPGFFLPSCTECKPGYYRYKHPLRLTTRCIRSCPHLYEPTRGNGYYGPTCEKKKLKCPFMPGCVDCPSFNMCYKCEQNMSIMEGILISRCVKQCPSGYHQRMENNTSVCFPEEGCFDRFCIMCKRGWHKMFGRGKQCHRECPIGHYVAVAGYCLTCPWGCEKCHRAFSCDKCSDGLISLSSSLGFGDRCVFTCPRGYIKEFVNGTGHVCHQDCLVSNCANCESYSFHGPYHCDFCKPGFTKIHRNSNDECIKNCPAGYLRDKGDLGGSVCRKVDFTLED